jgi:signal transduction histidine kinase/ActR/RegA family two-component response regulator
VTASTTTTAAATPIRRTLMTVILLTCGAALLTGSAAYCAYDFLSSRRQTLQNVATLAGVVAENSTAALAFENPDDAREVLAAFRAEPHIRTARLYTTRGALFASYPAADTAARTEAPPQDGYRFEAGFVIAVQPVVQNGHRLGTLYVKSDLGATAERLGNFVLIAILVLALSYAVAYLVSRRLQGQISRPILALTATASAISEQRDFTVRAHAAGGYELGLLTAAFNRMLERIESTQGKLQSQLNRLDLLHRITRATGERQDLTSIFLVLLRNLEDELPIDFGCVCLYDATGDPHSVCLASIGAHSREWAVALELAEGHRVPIDRNGLARCVTGQLVYEPDVAQIPFPFPQRFAKAGLQSLVLAPLLVEARVFGVLVVARRPAEAFNSAECEFLRQLSEHVALAANQAQLLEALQRAYDDLRQSQQTVMQQERLRALGQMASDIAHDINNAISPVSLYTESLLEAEQGLSDRARNCLVTIQRAIEDVAETVARMREFYRPREPELTLTRVRLNPLVEQVIELTRARWSDLSLRKGIMIRLHRELASELPEIMASEGEVRDSLTNLIFNAVDAMPDGGTLTLRTRHESAGPGEDMAARVCVEVTDTGIGMDEETRRRCLEPFYTTKGERGTGLGLAMVYGMVQRHSAEIDIESKVGVGTTIRLSFPADTASMVSAPSSVKPAVVIRRLRILLIDDDPVLIKSLRDTLEEEGHVVTATHGGQEGIDAFSSARRTADPYDVVITDLGMPHMDGRKVAAAIKALSSSTPIILLTGWGERLLADHETPENVDKVLSKPPRLTAVRAALAQLAGSTRGPDEPHG